MDVQPEKAGFSPDRLARITDHLNRNYIDSGKIAGCQTLVARHGHVAYFSSLGQRDLARGAPMVDDTIFRLYSMTKPMTSVALMQLFEQGHFQLTDPVSRVIPSWRDHEVWVSGTGSEMKTEKPRRPVTFRDVLCHTGGLTYGTALARIGVTEANLHPVDAAYDAAGVRGPGDKTLADMIAKLAKVPLRYHPGERWMYSLSTDVCGYLVEAISGERFDRYLRNHLFEPLGMTDTSFFVPEAKLARFAANYQRKADKSLGLIDDPFKSTYATEPTLFSGGGGLTGTTADYLKFAEMLRRGGELDGQRIIGPRTLEMMHRNHLAGGQDMTKMALGAFSETAYEGVGFGLGFAMTIDSVATGSLGEADYYWGGAASTIFWVDPKEDLVVIFMTQLMPSATFNFRGQLKSIIYSSIVE